MGMYICGVTNGHSVQHGVVTSCRSWKRGRTRPCWQGVARCCMTQPCALNNAGACATKWQPHQTAKDYKIVQKLSSWSYQSSTWSSQSNVNSSTQRAARASNIFFFFGAKEAKPGTERSERWKQENISQTVVIDTYLALLLPSLPRSLPLSRTHAITNELLPRTQP